LVMGLFALAIGASFLRSGVRVWFLNSTTTKNTLIKTE